MSIPGEIKRDDYFHLFNFNSQELRSLDKMEYKEYININIDNTLTSSQEKGSKFIIGRSPNVVANVNPQQVLPEMIMPITQLIIHIIPFFVLPFSSFNSLFILPIK